jgi:hypothetical protein
MSSSTNIVSFPSAETNPWIEEYQQAYLNSRHADTVRVYRHILQQFTQWGFSRWLADAKCGILKNRTNSSTNPFS